MRREEGRGGERAANKRCLFKASCTLPLPPTTGSKTTIVPTSDLFVLTFRPVHRVSRIFSTSSDNNYVQSERGSPSRLADNTQRFEFFELSPIIRKESRLRFDGTRFVKNLKKISMFFPLTFLRIAR